MLEVKQVTKGRVVVAAMMLFGLSCCALLPYWPESDLSKVAGKPALCKFTNVDVGAGFPANLGSEIVAQDRSRSSVVTNCATGQTAVLSSHPDYLAMRRTIRGVDGTAQGTAWERLVSASVANGAFAGPVSDPSDFSDCACAAYYPDSKIGRMR